MQILRVQRNKGGGGLADIKGMGQEGKGTAEAEPADSLPCIIWGCLS